MGRLGPAAQGACAPAAHLHLSCSLQALPQVPSWTQKLRWGNPIITTLRSLPLHIITNIHFSDTATCKQVLCKAVLCSNGRKNGFTPMKCGHTKHRATQIQLSCLGACVPHTASTGCQAQHSSHTFSMCHFAQAAPK